MNRVVNAPAGQDIIAAGGGRRPKPVETKAHKDPNPIGVEQFIQRQDRPYLFDPCGVVGDGGFCDPRVSLRFTRGYCCQNPCGVEGGR